MSDRDMSANENEVLSAMVKWVESGCDNCHLWPGLKAATFSLWLANHEEVDELREEAKGFLEASMTEAGGSASIWHKKQYCPSCGERYSLENMQTCTGCSVTYCCRCIWDYKDNDTARHIGSEACSGEFY